VDASTSGGGDAATDGATEAALSDGGVASE
jgi:hypothetical protein